MSEKINGGPAFPTATTDMGDGTKCWGADGMTLRDYFAAHAPIDLADARSAFHDVEGNYVKPSGDVLLKLLAEMRMAYANEMLKARES